jgi:hypothetical protein
MKKLLLIATALSALPLVACTGSNSNAPTTPTAPSCSTSAANPTVSSFGADGGTGSVAVTATASTCAWTAVSNASFITITSGAAVTSSGTTVYAVAANTGAARTGTITVAGTTFTISQSASTTPVTLAAPVAVSPVNGLVVTDTRPSLVINNSATTGTPGTVTYRFEISDQPTFPSDAARTFSVDGVAQTAGTTTGVVPRDLGQGVVWYWHARATNGTVTSAYSATASFQSPGVCSFSLSTTNITANPAGGSATVNVLASTSTCAWTAASNASFITIGSGSSGTGNGTVTLNFAASAGAARTGTVTIAGLTLTVSQASNGIAASFIMVDTASQPGATTECRIRSLTGATTTCTLQSTSFTLGTTTIVNYAWEADYTYSDFRSNAGTGPGNTFSFQDKCGLTGASDDGVSVALTVRLTVTDSAGNTQTVISGQGNQPALVVRLFNCGI